MSTWLLSHVYTLITPQNKPSHSTLLHFFFSAIRQQRSHLDHSYLRTNLSPMRLEPGSKRAFTKAARSHCQHPCPRPPTQTRGARGEAALRNKIQFRWADEFLFPFFPPRLPGSRFHLGRVPMSLTLRVRSSSRHARPPTFPLSAPLPLALHFSLPRRRRGRATRLPAE